MEAPPSHPPTIWVRLDAGAQLGAGHAVRTGALVEAIWPKPRVVVIGALERGGLIRADDVVAPDEDLGDLARRLPPDLVVCDHPTRGGAFLAAAGCAVDAPLVAVDDAGGELPADLVVSGTGPASAGGFRGLRPGGRVLAGLEYALLRPDFAAARAAAPRSRFPLVVAVGSGPRAAAWLLDLVAQLADRPCPGAAVVVGRTFADLPGLRAVAGRAGLSLHVGLPGAELAEALAGAELALVTGGMVALEALAAGAPTIVHACDPAMGPECAWLAERGAIALIALGSGPAVARAAVAELQADPGRARTLGRRGAEIVDGRGAARVARAIRSLVSERDAV